MFNDRTLSLLDCKHHLCEPDMKLVWPSAKLLQAAAGASLRAYDQITSSVLPLLIEQYTKHVQVRANGNGTSLCMEYVGIEIGHLKSSARGTFVTASLPNPGMFLA